MFVFAAIGGIRALHRHEIFMRLLIVSLIQIPASGSLCLDGVPAALVSESSCNEEYKGNIKG